MSVAREIAKQQAEQAKLAGAYIKDAANPSDQSTIAKQVAAELTAMGKTPEYVAEFIRNRYGVSEADLLS